jgi:hypothetical protein
LAPNPKKLQRVCDSCFLKLKNASDTSNGESNGEARVGKSILSSNMDMIRSLDNKAAKQGKRTDALSFLRNPQVSSLLQLRDIAFSGGVDLNKPVPRAVRTSARSVATSRAVSPFSRKSSPPRSTTPVPTTHGLSFSKSATDNLVKTNELLNQEVERLRAQVFTLFYLLEISLGANYVARNSNYFYMCRLIA